jgi:hypothetical protein
MCTCVASSTLQMGLASYNRAHARCCEEADLVVTLRASGGSVSLSSDAQTQHSVLDASTCVAAASSICTLHSSSTMHRWV